jgi:phosphopantetheinyl transferase (holo-ACP synthase)
MALTNYKSEIWGDFQEEDLLDFLETGFGHAGYNVINYHKIDRPHERGVDLLCTNENGQIAIQAKKKPKKGDCAQFDLFASCQCSKTIYVFLQQPTKEFSEHIKNRSDVEFWNADNVHSFLIENEVIPYCCLYFSKHPLVTSLTKVHEIMFERRKTNYTAHRFSNIEIAKLWAAKDNIVKVWTSIFFIYHKWNFALMHKTEKDRKEFESIISEIIKDLDIALNISGHKFLYSFEDLSEDHPDIIGFMWRLASNRSNWAEYTIRTERAQSLSDARFLTNYVWVCPVYNNRVNCKMNGFYSSMNYLLQHFADIAKNLEYVIDWAFEHMNEN